MLNIELLKIKCRDHCLASTSGSYNKVAPTVMGRSLPLQSVEDAFLKWMRCQVKENGWRQVLRTTSPLDSTSQALRRIYIKWNELATIPIGLELGCKLLKNMFHILSSYL